MTYQGKVFGGKVVLPPEANLPDGTEVRVEPIDPSRTGEPVLKKLLALAGTARGSWWEPRPLPVHDAKAVKAMSAVFVDMSFVVMPEDGMAEALTGDSHFEQPGLKPSVR